MQNTNDASPSSTTTPWGRRDFLKRASLAVGALALQPGPAFAGPFTREDFDHLVPADKKLSAEWVKSLFERGVPQVLRGGELDKVGMPVGGIGAGQLYLGGDGRLWHWDIFNQAFRTGAEHYVNPLNPTSPLEQRFTLKIGDRIRPLDRKGFAEVSFRGEYPIGKVEYADPEVPLAVSLEAFAPFIPLNTDDSSLPATILNFTLRNTSAAAVEAVLSGLLENAVCLHHRDHGGLLCNRILREDGSTTLLCSAEKPETVGEARPEIVLEDWSKPAYAGWTSEGTAFGSGPVRKSDIPAYQGNVGGDTEFVVNSHTTAPGSDIGLKDASTGKLNSREFKIERNFIQFWIGGGKALPGSHAGLTLFVDGQAVQTASGDDNNAMARKSFDVRAHAGKTARLEILDDATGGWGNVGVGKIVLTDHIDGGANLEELPDFGTLALGLLGGVADRASEDATVSFSEKLTGHLDRAVRLEPGASATVTYVIAWHFPNLSLKGPLQNAGRYYATKFASAHAVVRYIAAQFGRLAGETRRWRDTWYDSTLPFWFLDRTLLNASILATSTCYRFANGRFYGWEGVGCCEGTCGHVYHYAHSAARLFPDLERVTRERVDFGLALKPDGAIHFRGEYNNYPAVDGQAGTILRVLREHQMSADSEFLKRNWPAVKKATQWLIAKDGNADGIIEGNQHNTLDADWFGPVTWLSGLYLAALLGAAEMADLMGDTAFAAQCRGIVEPGRKYIVEQLFDGEYFINKPDPNHPEAINSGTGCEIDQVFGQGWAFQVGLPRVLPQKETVAALKSLWRYNFSPDVGPYRAANKPGRWYAVAGEAGLLMCTFPRKDWDYGKAKGKGVDWAAGYFNECMNGFEYQAASHMIWEGLTMEGLAVTRAVHDRYGASRRNPWNEIECGDHYARSMASHGVYLAACGFQYDGPKGRLGFAPRITPEDFRCAFTAAEGWGTFRQKITGTGVESEVILAWGKLAVKTLSLGLPANLKPAKVSVVLDGKAVAATMAVVDSGLEIHLAAPVTIPQGQSLLIKLA